MEAIFAAKMVRVSHGQYAEYQAIPAIKKNGIPGQHREHSDYRHAGGNKKLLMSPGRH